MADPASERQRQASDPTASVWVHANAGSGKTKVLIDRVARLLLSGVQPQNILCLTYTKAAAAEMQNRLFKRLGNWAMKPDADLRGELRQLGEDGAIGAATLALARQLFARAIETPGGLRIQTIHSFCASLLRRFPLEAGVSPQFTELDPRATMLLREDVADALGDTGEMAALAKAYTGDEFTALLGQIADARDDFAYPLDRDAARDALGVPPDETMAGILADVLVDDCADWMPAVISAMARGSVTDVKHAERLAALVFEVPGSAMLETLEDVFLYGDTAKAGPFSAKTGAVPTKPTQAKLGNHMPALNDLMLRVESARARRIALVAAEKTEALHAYAALFLPLYAARKAARGWLDFDDLISRARGLLTNPAVAQWVLYRLDGGIDHILVDEAQDTSPAQWMVIESLAAEFTSGQGARDVPRTIFVVGDKKQSIYSFQGADVAAFDRMQQDFRQRLQNANQALVLLDLEYSFRSSDAILRLVDSTFNDAAHAALGGHMQHLAYHADMPGRIELWPVEEPSEKAEEKDWTDPVDILTDDHHNRRLAKKIAGFIADTVAARTQIPTHDGARALHFGDFLVLVQKRSGVFAEIIRACKLAGLPIAGADRLKLGGELAVKDLAALLSFLCTDVDDLSLAAVLRSPLCGWSEAQLYALAQPRKGYLWEALRDAKEEFAQTHAMLTDLRNQADFLRPYDLLERVLTRHDGRRKLLARLGSEAEDGIDELLSQALAYEATEVPSLTGFLGWLTTDDIEVKRQLEGIGHRIRVMTVHGAKGLEAPIVILPDTADPVPRDRDQFIALPDDLVVWRTEKTECPAVLAQENAARAARAAAEKLRLLYVAMTRPQSWLVVAAAGTVSKADSWYTLIGEGMTHAGATRHPDGAMTYATGRWPAPATAVMTTTVNEVPDAWMLQPAAVRANVAALLSPSQLPGAKALPGEDGLDSDAAMARGTALHRLLENLPDATTSDWSGLARQIAGEADADVLLAEVTAILRAPGLAHVFGPQSLAEVGVTGQIGDQVLFGSIDRLIVGDDHVLAVDFKSNRMVPATADAVPLGIMRQMAVYVVALQQIYPHKQVDAAVLWTRSAVLMPLAPQAMADALNSMGPTGSATVIA